MKADMTMMEFLRLHQLGDMIVINSQVVKHVEVQEEVDARFDDKLVEVSFKHRSDMKFYFRQGTVCTVDFEAGIIKLQAHVVAYSVNGFFKNNIELDGKGPLVDIELTKNAEYATLATSADFYKRYNWWASQRRIA